MTTRNRWRSVLTGALGLCPIVGCGGGGDGPPPPARPPHTRFIGNLADQPVARDAQGVALGGTAGVVVCIDGTTVCVPVGEDGTFELDAAVGGEVVLRFSAPDFTARLALSGVPAGATVRITDVRCSLVTGRCDAADIEIVGGEVNTAPRCDAAVARPAVLWPPNHSMRAIAIAGVVDADGDRVTISVSDIFQDEPVDDAGDGAGHTAPDAVLDPPSVRAERSGQGDGRVYHLLFTASDGRGGVCSGVVEVCVPHDQRPAGTCVDDGGQFDSLG